MGFFIKDKFPSQNVFVCEDNFFKFYLSFSYQELMKESSRMPLFDLRKLNALLPVPSVPKSAIELLVLGANDDFIVVSSLYILLDSFSNVVDVNMLVCNFQYVALLISVSAIVFPYTRMLKASTR